MYCGDRVESDNRRNEVANLGVEAIAKQPKHVYNPNSTIQEIQRAQATTSTIKEEPLSWNLKTFINRRAADNTPVAYVTTRGPVPPMTAQPPG
jgi:hypothetical protein